MVAERIRLRYRLATALCWLLPQFSATTVRAAVYRSLGVRAARRVAFLGNIQMIGPGPNPYRRLAIGEDSIISAALFELEDNIKVGRRVCIGPGARIYTSKHPIGPAYQRFTTARVSAPVKIEDGVWIGVGVIILAGVTIGHGAVVSAGSVVSRDVPPNTLVSGVNAVVVKHLSNDARTDLSGADQAGAGG